VSERPAGGIDVVGGESEWRAGCALTFDDGPDPLWTARLLTCLRNEGARATFFVMAGRAVAHPRLLERMQAEGHEIGFHCVRHVRHTELDETALRRDTRTGLRVLERLGVRARLWRAPWGVTTTASEAVAADLGLELVHWDLDTHDWRGDSAAAMHASIAGDLRPGSVVLMHDGLGPGARRSGCRETIRLVAPLLATLRSMRLRPAVVGELRP
jgi:peptidoglycan/xylan/chitin deacetylase (PgdA/CDA1 family)